MSDGGGGNWGTRNAASATPTGEKNGNGNGTGGHVMNKYMEEAKGSGGPGYHRNGPPATVQRSVFGAGNNNDDVRLCAHIIMLHFVSFKDGPGFTHSLMTCLMDSTTPHLSVVCVV